MNRCYRLVWNRARRLFVVASEHSRQRGKAGRASGTRRAAWLALLPLGLAPTLGMAAAVSGAIAPAVQAPRPALVPVSPTVGPHGGQVTAGSGRISQNGLTTTIDQRSQNLSLNWQSFNIGASSTVNFVQPNARSIAVNRIADANGSVILGRLNANGQVFLINPNGVLFGQGAQVNVGGLVASTLNVSDSELTSGTRHFSGNGNGSIVNQGTISAGNGGYIALLGLQVTNHGTLNAPDGTVALAGGNAVTLSFDSNRLLSLQVDKSTLNALADNRQLIVADGGQVLMSAGAKDSLLASVVNNSGTIQAQTVENRAGKIVLLGGMAAGATQVAGTLDASAPNGGNGGFIETSAANVHVADGTKISTLAGAGRTGTWLIDPVDFTIAASGGDMTGAVLSNSLASADVTIQSTAGAGGTAGDINVNDQVSWDVNQLTLNAQNNININADLNGSGTAKLALEYGQATADGTGSSYTLRGGKVNLAAGDNFSTKQGSGGATRIYTVVTSLGVAGDTGITSLQGMGNNLAGNYVLGANIDASATSGWNDDGHGSYAGFAPLGSGSTRFTGIFDGLGHTISGLVIDRPTTSGVGLFGFAGNGNVIRNIGLLGGSVNGSEYVGGLVGFTDHGTITNAYNTGTVNGMGNEVGGLVGQNNYGAISQSHATGAVSGASISVGGLVGYNYFGTLISQVYATGAVSSGYGVVGGLVGQNVITPISEAYATGPVTGMGQWTGGLVGYNNGSLIEYSYATGSVTGTTGVGGLVGHDEFGTISGTYATGAIHGTSGLGGLIGDVYNASTAISSSYWNSDVSAIGIGGGTGAGATGLTSVQMQTAANFAGFNFTSTPGAAGNNWVMVDGDGSLNNAGGAAGATRPMLASEYSTTINNAHQLQLMAMDLNAHYALGQNIDAGATGTTDDVWAKASFVPIGKDSRRFLGAFDGQSHAIANLTINTGLLANRPTPDFVGLFGATGIGSILHDVGLVGGSITGRYAGALVGNNNGTLSHSYATSNVVGTTGAGGLVYQNIGTIDASYAAGTVSGVTVAGGLAATNYGNFADAVGTINNSYATGNVHGVNLVGGLVGTNQSAATITNSHATGEVDATGNDVGGLVGNNEYIVANSYATGSVTSTGNHVGGLVGKNVGGATSLPFSRGGAISNSYANGAVSGNDQVGGLVGTNGEAGAHNYAGSSRTILNSYATGNVSGNNQVGGLAGANIGDQGGYGESMGDAVGTTGALSSIANSYATGAVTSAGDYSGGLVGLNQGGRGGEGGMADMGMDGGNGGVGGAAMVLDSYASGTVAGSGHTGSLIGFSAAGELGNTGASYDDGLPGQGGTGGQAAQTGSSSLDASAMTQLASFSNWNDAAPNTISRTGGSGAVWRIYEGHTGPLLTSFMTGLTLAGAPDVTTTYNGNIQNGASISAPSGVLGAAATGTHAGFYNGYYSTQLGYDITGGNLTIDPAALSAISLDGTRAYDGTTNVAAGIFTLSGLVGSEDLTLTGIGTIARKNVGTYSVNLGSLTLGDGVTGLASNYTFIGGTQTATITKAALVISSTGVSKIYDGNVTAAGTATGALLGGDTLSGGTFTFDNKNVGTGKRVAVSGVTVNDGNHGNNYTVSYADSTHGSITPRTVGVHIDARTADKVYDGSTAADVTLASGGLLAGDVVFLDGSAAFADRNVGRDKTVTVSGINASGADAGNYAFSTTALTTADITPATLTYRATPAFFWAGQALDNLSGVVTGLVGGDTLADATSGTPGWTTSATSASPAGLYAVDGSGLSALNYVFAQAADNATALRIVNGSVPRVVIATVAGLQQGEALQGGTSSDDEAHPRFAPSTRTAGAPNVRIVGGGVRLP